MRQTDSLFPRELGGLLKRVGAVTTTALLVLAVVLAGSASFDSSPGRQHPLPRDPGLALPASPLPANPLPANTLLASPAPWGGVV